MIKKLLTITAIFVFAISASSLAQKIGYMDTQEVMNKLPQREQVANEMQTFIQQKQDSLESRATAYQDAVSDYQSKKASMSQQEIKNREDELTAMQQSLDEYNQTIRNEIQQKRNALLNPIYKRIDEAISAVAEAKGLDLVLNKSTNNGQPLLFYASGNQTDITPLVVSRLTSNSKN